MARIGMKPGFVAIVALVASALPGVAGQKVISWRAMGLQGHVKTFQEQVFVNPAEADSGESPFEVAQTAFNEEGFAWSVRVSQPNQVIKTYNLQGPLVITEHEESSDTRSRDVAYQYDSQRRLIESKDSADGEDCTVTIAYDELSETRTESCGGTPRLKVCRTHAPESNEMLVQHYSYSEAVHDWVLESGPIERETVDANGQKRTETLGKCRSVLVVDTFDNVVEDFLDCPLSYHRETYEYNQFGWLLSKSEWQRDGGMINSRTYDYVKDFGGNWIRRTEWFTSSAMSDWVVGEVTLRRIEYF